MKSLVLVSVVLVLLLTACQTNPFAPANPPPPPTCEELTQQEKSPENLLFETIARGSVPTQFWPETKAGLFVATEPQDVDQITPHIEEEAVAVLREVDFDASVVVATFSGSKGRLSWQFCITSVAQQENKIVLHMHLVDSFPTLPETASFYHLIRLPREELPTGEITFYLALTRHEYAYVGPNQSQAVLERSEEEIVSSITRSLP